MVSGYHLQLRVPSLTQVRDKNQRVDMRVAWEELLA